VDTLQPLERWSDSTKADTQQKEIRLVQTEFLGPQNVVYTLEAKLGNGAFGEVYRAKSPDGDTVAIKVILGLANQRAMSALLNDIGHAVRVNHPNVVRVLHAHPGDDKTVPYLMMELIEGGTLKDLIAAKSGKIELTVALNLMAQIASGMAAVNEHVIHRDLKPDNILLTIDGTLKIADFGISKLVTEATRDLTFKGGQHMWYMAPEGWAYDKNTIELDVYAAGLVFYELLTGKHAYSGVADASSTPEKWRQTHLYAPLPDVGTIRSDVPLNVRQLLLRMVAKRPQERPKWSDTIALLAEPATSSTERSNVSFLVEAATKALHQRKAQENRHQEALDKQREQANIHKYSCSSVLTTLDALVETFNRESQLGKIETIKSSNTHIYRLPTGAEIKVDFFKKFTDSKLKMRGGGRIVSGGYISSDSGCSANLVLKVMDDEDLYGEWSACFIGISDLVNPSQLFGTRGVRPGMRLPFAFTNERDFIEEMAFAGAMHVFTYDFQSIENAFERILLDTFRVTE